MSLRAEAPGSLGALAGAASVRLAWLTDRVCAVIAVVLVVDVWLGVFVRYVWPLPITFTEEAARYLMIWMALLAVSCAISRREHIGVQLFFDRFPRSVQRWLLLGLDMLAFAFFLLLLYYGIELVEKGASRFTMIYGMNKSLPFAAVPVGAATACIQLVLVAIRDQYRFFAETGDGES